MKWRKMAWRSGGKDNTGEKGIKTWALQTYKNGHRTKARNQRWRAAAVNNGGEKRNGGVKMKWHQLWRIEMAKCGKDDWHMGRHQHGGRVGRIMDQKHRAGVKQNAGMEKRKTKRNRKGNRASSRAAVAHHLGCSAWRKKKKNAHQHQANIGVGSGGGAAAARRGAASWQRHRLRHHRSRVFHHISRAFRGLLSIKHAGAPRHSQAGGGVSG